MFSRRACPGPGWFSCAGACLAQATHPLAWSPAVQEAAVYFKSGSLYGCTQEPDCKCRKHKINARNSMNSFAIIESPAGERRLHDRVVLISNVLRKNRTCDHQTLATWIHDIIEEAHPVAPDMAVEPGGAAP